MKIKLKPSRIIAKIGPVSLDKHDILLLVILIIIGVLVSFVFGKPSIFIYLLFGIILRNVLLAKGHLKRK